MSEVFIVTVGGFDPEGTYEEFRWRFSEGSNEVMSDDDIWLTLAIRMQRQTNFRPVYPFRREYVR